MKHELIALVVFVAVGASLSACAGDLNRSVPPAAITSIDTTGRVVSTGVITSDDPRSHPIADLVAEAVPELHLQSVIFGVWIGEREIVKGAIDAPSVQPPTPVDARVRVGQPMEAMLGTVLLQLGSEGRIHLDEPVAKYVPQLVNGDRITPRMLANCTGGTPDYVPDPAFQARVLANPFAGYRFDELLGFAQQRPPLFAPGTSFAYSHTEMAALVQVLEKASGQSLGDLMATRVFRPLGMTASAAHQNNAIEEPAFHAFTHMRGVYEDSTYWDPTWGFGGGMNASVDDLGRWLRALNRGALLNAADAEESLAPVTAGLAKMTDRKYFAYGSLVSGGWIVGNPSLNGYMGFTAQHRDPPLTIVVWSTSGPSHSEESNASQTISQRIAGIVSDEPIDLSAPSAGSTAGEPSSEGDAPATTAASRSEAVARTVDIGAGRSMYLECAGNGTPTVVLVSGLRSSAQEWHTSESTAIPPAPPVFEEVARTHRVCAYDRPGTVVGDEISRSDPVPQPTSAAAAAADLHALLAASGEPGPFVLVGHSIGGTIVRLYAATHPDAVHGMVLVDASSEFLQDNETPEQWTIQRQLMKVDGADIADSLAEYPDIERFDIDATFAALRAAPALRPMPLVVISADALLGPQFPAMIAAGTLPAGTPPDFGATFDAAQAKAQARLAQLVPGAVHITRTHSGHNVHLVQPQIVTEAIRSAAGVTRPQNR